MVLPTGKSDFFITCVVFCFPLVVKNPLRNYCDESELSSGEI